MKLTVKWDNLSATWGYILTDGDKFWSGDLPWAQRIAEHYGLVVPKTEG